MEKGYGLREGQVEMKMFRKFYIKLYLFQLNISLTSKTNCTLVKYENQFLFDSAHS